MTRTCTLLLIMAALMAAPAFAAAKKAVKAAPVKEEAKVTLEPTAEPTKEAVKEEPKKDAEEKSADASANHKSSGLAITLAIIPGIAVHGAGHMYAGSWMKGLGLLAIEGASIGIGLNTYNAASSDIDSMLNNKSSQISTSVGENYGRFGILLVCTAGFLYTWFDDLVGASKAVNVYNKKADAEAQTGFQLIPQSEGAVLAYRRTF